MSSLKTSRLGAEKNKDGVRLAQRVGDINYKDINGGGNVCHYNNTKHMKRGASDHNPYETLA